MNRAVTLLLAGQLVSQIGDKVYLLALSYWVMETTKSAAKMGLVLGVATATLVVCGLFSGSLADRWNRKTILAATDAARGLVILAVGLALHAHALTLPLVVLSQILVAALGSLFNATIPAILPQLAGARQLSRANARRAFISAISSLSGPILGGLLAFRYGYEATVFFNAWSFFAAAAFTACLAYQPGPAATPVRLAQGLREGYAYLFSQRRLVAFLGIVVALHAFAGSLQVIAPLLAGALAGNYAKNLGVLQTFLGAGGVAMALLLSVLSLRRREVPALLAGVLGVGLAYVGIACLLGGGSRPAVWVCGCALAAASGSILVASTGYETYLQANVANAMAGRVFGVMNALGSSTMAVSMLGFGVLAERSGLALALAASGLMMSVLASGFLLGAGTGAGTAGEPA